MAELLESRERLVARVAHWLDGQSRAFLQSVEDEKPDFNLIGLAHAAELPGVRRKLHNLAQRTTAKRAQIAGSLMKRWCRSLVPNDEGGGAMVQGFTLVYVVDSGMGSQEDVLRWLTESDCADATVGWGRPGHVALAFSREASHRDAAAALATAQMSQALPWAVPVRVDAG